MHFWIGVENFAKIESAKICVDNYTVLVGENNSGKTFLMQLVQGVGKKIVNLIDETIMNEFLTEETVLYKHYLISDKNVSKITSFINEKLKVEKEHIIKEIFGKDITAERLYIDISMDEKTIYDLVILASEDFDKKNLVEIVNCLKIDSSIVEAKGKFPGELGICIANKKK